MKRIVFVLILALCSNFCVFAQEAVQSEDPKVSEMRQQIGIGHSMTEFNTKKNNGNVIVVRLATMLVFLQNNHAQGTITAN